MATARLLIIHRTSFSCSAGSLTVPSRLKLRKSGSVLGNAGGLDPGIGVGIGFVEGRGPFRVSVSIESIILVPGPYDCQLTVLDWAGGKAAFWQAPVFLVP